MPQSILAVTSPLDDPQGFAHPFCQTPRFFSLKVLPGEGGQGLDQVKFFPKLIKIYSVFIFLVAVFKRQAEAQTQS